MGEAESQFPTTRQRTFEILEHGRRRDFASRIVDWILVILILANVAGTIAQTLPRIEVPYGKDLQLFDRFCVLVFAIEYLARMWVAPEHPLLQKFSAFRARLRFATTPMMIIDALAFVPLVLELLFPGLPNVRLIRLVRFLKLARYSQALPALLAVLYAQRSALFASFVLTLCVMCFSADLMHIAEGGVQPNVFGNMPDAMYWAITTLTTVGYGDETPITWAGKLWAGITMVTGLVLFALPVGIIATGFVNGLHKREFSITWSMVKRQPLFDGFEVDAIRQILDTMGATVVQDHTRIAVAGQEADMFYLVISGRAHSEDENGSWEIEAGDIIGEESLHDGQRYGRTVWARTEMRMMNLTGEDLRRLARKYPLLGQRIRNEIPW